MLGNITANAPCGTSTKNVPPEHLSFYSFFSGDKISELFCLDSVVLSFNIYFSLHMRVRPAARSRCKFV